MSRRLFLAVAVVLLLVGPAPAGKKKVVLLGQGPDGHPAATHEYAAGLRVLAKCLAGVEGLETTTVMAEGAWKDGPELIERADGVVLFLAEGAKWLQADPARHKALTKVAQRGGGIVALHWAIGTKDEKPIEDFVKLVGGCHGGADRKYKVLETDVKVADAKHPITTGIESFKVKDEFYYKLKFAKPEGSVTPILKATIDDAAETVAWAWKRPDGGRAFGFSGLHFHDNWTRVEYRRLVAQAVVWTLDLPIPREGLPVKVTADDLKLK